MSSKHARNVAALKSVVADGSRKAAAAAEQADRKARVPVRLSLTPQAEAVIEEPGGARPPGHQGNR